MRSSQVTIKDIAKELKISASTVSRALKNHPSISDKTKKAVVATVLKLWFKLRNKNGSKEYVRN